MEQPLLNAPPEGPYITIETRWGNSPGRALLSESAREVCGVGPTIEELKNQSFDRVQAKITEGEMMVSCHIHHNSYQGALLLGSWQYDANTHSEPVWTPGANI